MVLCLKYSPSTLYHPGNILLQTMLINSEVLLVPNILGLLLYLVHGALTSQVYASSAVLQMNKDIQKLWHYAALQWHKVTTKYPEYQCVTSRSVGDGWINSHTGIHGIRALRIPFLRTNRVDILKEINVQGKKIIVRQSIR
jgi:hypothetical protein